MLHATKPQEFSGSFINLKLVQPFFFQTTSDLTNMNSSDTKSFCSKSLFEFCTLSLSDGSSCGCEFMSGENQKQICVEHLSQLLIQLNNFIELGFCGFSQLMTELIIQPHD